MTYRNHTETQMKCVEYKEYSDGSCFRTIRDRGVKVSYTKYTVPI